METLRRQCKICHHIVSDENFKLIDDSTKHICGILLLNLDFEDETQNAMCKICFSKLLAALKFKATCLHADDIIDPYIDLKYPNLVDLKEVYLKENGRIEESGPFNDQDICRLCLKTVNSEQSKSIHEVLFDNIHMFIPEINFAVSENPAICVKCREELQVHSSFVKISSGIEEQINVKEIEVGYMPFNIACIKTEEIEIKSEITNDEELSVNVDIFYSEREDEGDTPVQSSNDLIDGNSLTAQPSKKKPLQAQKYRCDQCDYTSIRRNNLKVHELKHKEPPHVYTCEECEYKTLNQKYLRLHQLTHTNPSKVQIHRCDECDYESTRKWDLKVHQLRHKDASQVRMFKCGECDYETFMKVRLKAHKLRHKDVSEVQVFECDKCDYKCMFKSYLTSHQLRHKERMFRCNECDYRSILKSSLRRHMLKHVNSTQQD